MRDDPFEALVEITPHRSRHRSQVDGFPVPGRAPRQSPIGKEYMLHQDLDLYVLPYGRGTAEGFRLDLVPPAAEIRSLVTAALPGRGYRRTLLSEAFRDYVQSASQLLLEGDLFLEISYYGDPRSTSDRPSAFSLEFLFPEMMSRRFERVRYLTPVGAQDEEPVAWSFETLDKERLVVGSLPRKTRRALQKTLKLIRAADGDLDVMSAFTTGRYGANSGFDLNMYQRKVNDTVLIGSRRIGWTGRGLFTDGLLDPMKAWRAIQFARFVTDVRDVAVSTLQAAVDRAGATIGFKAELVLVGGLTQDDLAGYERDLQAGTRAMSTLLSPLLRPVDD